MSGRCLRRHMVAQAHLLVVLIHKHQLRLVHGHLVLMHLGERRNDEQVICLVIWSNLCIDLYFSQVRIEL